jgi:hypothetical protein
MFSPSVEPTFTRNELTLRLPHRITALLLIAIPAYLSMQVENRVLSANKHSVPNIVLILADDKC